MPGDPVSIFALCIHILPHVYHMHLINFNFHHLYHQYEYSKHSVGLSEDRLLYI